MGLTDVSILLNVAFFTGIVVILCSSENRRRLAAYLLASATANDEIRSAKLAILAESKIRQADLQRQFLKHPNSLLGVSQDPSGERQLSLRNPVDGERPDDRYA